MLGELFGAESKAQVYGTIHAFLHENKDATEGLSKYIMVTIRSKYITPIGKNVDYSCNCTLALHPALV
jgi:hypothetical protein